MMKMKPSMNVHQCIPLLKWISNEIGPYDLDVHTA